jgi:hypothetical protein
MSLVVNEYAANIIVIQPWAEIFNKIVRAASFHGNPSMLRLVNVTNIITSSSRGQLGSEVEENFQADLNE